MDSNTKTYAKNELDILLKSTPNPIIKDFIPEILELVDKFGKSGQSGGSAPYVSTAISQAVKHLCMQQPICPITGEEYEWNDVSKLGDGSILYQNNRCSGIFKNGSVYYLDAIVWETQNGMRYSGMAILPNGEKIRSRQCIKSFPFEPKTFYIDVIEKEVVKDDFEFYVKDESQLKDVFDYYNKYKE